MFDDRCVMYAGDAHLARTIRQRRAVLYRMLDQAELDDQHRQNQQSRNGMRRRAGKRAAAETYDRESAVHQGVATVTRRTKAETVSRSKAARKNTASCNFPRTSRSFAIYLAAKREFRTLDRRQSTRPPELD